MTCRQVQKSLQAFVDGALDRAAASRVEAHLAACPECRYELEVYRELEEAAADEPTPEPSPEMVSEIVRRALKGSRVGQQRAIPGWLEGLTLFGVALSLTAASALFRSMNGAWVGMDALSLGPTVAAAAVIVLGAAGFAGMCYRKSL
jgi:anti-sigma factor RsiW